MKKKLFVGALVILVVVAAAIGYQINEMNKEEEEVVTFYDHALDEYYPIFKDINNHYDRSMNETILSDWVVEAIKERSDLRNRLETAIDETVNTDLEYPTSLEAKKNLLNIMMTYEDLIALDSELGLEAERDFLLYADDIQKLLDQREGILGKYYDFSNTTESASE